MLIANPSIVIQASSLSSPASQSSPRNSSSSSRCVSPAHPQSSSLLLHLRSFFIHAAVLALPPLWPSWPAAVVGEVATGLARPAAGPKRTALSALELVLARRLGTTRRSGW